MLQKLCRRGEGGVKLHWVTGIIDLVELVAEPAAACKVAGVLECYKKARASVILACRVILPRFLAEHSDTKPALGPFLWWYRRQDG